MQGRWYFRFKGVSSATVFTGEAWGCSDDSPVITSSPQASCIGGLRWEIFASGRDNAIYRRISDNNRYFYTCGSGQLQILEQSFIPDAASPISCDISTGLYDCINGTCELATKYSTPGTYQSLEECEAACGGVGSICNGECVGKGKLSQLKNLSNKLKRKNCGC